MKNTFLITIIMLLAILLCACLPEIKIERNPEPRGTLGEEIFKMVYDNVERSPEDPTNRAEAFLNYRADFIYAVDNIAEEPMLEELNLIFRRIIPMYEKKLYQAALRKIAIILNDFTQKDENLAALKFFNDYETPLKYPENEYLVAHIFKYPKLPQFTKLTLDLIQNPNTTPALRQLIQAIYIITSDLELNNDEHRLSYKIFDKLTDPDRNFLPPTPTRPLEFVKLDHRGCPKIPPISKFSVYHPFIDKDNDNLPDCNDKRSLILSNNKTINPFFLSKQTENELLNTRDNFGRLIYNKQPAFFYADLNATPLSYLIRTSAQLFKDTTIDDLLRATGKILGNPTKLSDKHGEYNAYPADSPLYALSYGFIQTLDHDNLGYNLEAAIQILEKHPETVAKLFHDFKKIINIVEELNPDIQLDNNLIDELLPLFLEIVETPGLLKDLFDALNQPLSKEIAPILSQLASIKKDFITVDENSNYNQCFQKCRLKHKVGTIEAYQCIKKCPTIDVIGNTPINHNEPESLSNRSIFQRIMALMWETSETNYNVDIKKFSVGSNDFTSLGNSLGNILTMNNLAELYLKTFTSEMDLKNHINPQFIKIAKPLGLDTSSVIELTLWITYNLYKLKLSEYPTTAEVTRFFNTKELSSKKESYTFDLNVAICKSKFTCLQANADTLYAIEATGLVDALHPVISIFNKYNKTALFAKLASLIYTHYPSIQYKDANNQPLPFTTDNLRAIEPVLIRILQETNIINSTSSFASIFTQLRVSDGQLLLDRLTQYLAFLFKPDPSLKNHLGQNTALTPKNQSISPISPVYLLITPIRDLARQIDKDPNLKKQFKNALEGIARATIQTIETDGKINFEKPAGTRIAALFLKIILEQFNDLTKQNKRHNWIYNTALPELKNIFTSRILYAFYQFFNELDKNPENLQEFRDITLHILEADKEFPSHLPSFLLKFSPLLLEQNKLHPLAAFIASSIDLNRVWNVDSYENQSFIETTLQFLHEFNKQDPSGTFTRVFYNLFQTQNKTISNLQMLLNTAKAVVRQNPGTHENYTIDDYRYLMQFAYHYFIDEDRGVERIYKTVEFTIWGTKGRPKDWTLPQNNEEQ